MSKLYSNSDGKLIRLLLTESDENQYGPPEEYSDMIEFDRETNAEIIAGINSDWNSHTLINDILTNNGVELPINPPGQNYQDRDYLRGFWNNLQSAIDTLEQGLALWPTLTTNQKQAFIVNNFDKVMVYLLGILRFIRWLIRGYLRLSGL